MKQWIYLSLSSFLLVGCMNHQPLYRPVPPKPKVKPQAPEVKTEKPTEVHELKEVQDNNFDPDYMYPETPKRTRKASHNTSSTTTVPAAKAAESMTRDECISMIGQSKFDKYTQMLGSESAAIKRCIMIRSMK
jgi:hypothetical protein